MPVISRPIIRKLACLVCALSIASLSNAAEWQVQLPADDAGTASGRLLLLLEPFAGQDKLKLAANAVYPRNLAVASQDITAVAAGSTITLDTRANVYKQDFATLPAGEYLAQAWLDPDYLYNLDQGGAGDRYSAGQPKGVARNDTGIVTTIADAARMERVLGPQGGVFQAAEWIFSPPDRLAPLFDRDSGAIDPAVARYWREHYDLSFYIRENWPRLAPLMNGKLHVIVGTADDHYLEDPVCKLRDTMAELGADADFEFIPDKTHNNLFSDASDPLALFRRIAAEMYAMARE